LTPVHLRTPGSEYEFYAGEEEASGASGSSRKAKWSRDIADAEPLFRWWNQTGITACTHFPNLRKMLCVVETTCLHCGVSTQFDFDTYLLEADSPSGEFPPGSAFKLVTYMESFGPEAYFVHIPSRFSPDNPEGTGFMAAAANFAEGSKLQAGGCGCSHCTVYGKCAMGGLLHPTGATYGMNLQRIRLCGPLLNISCESAPRTTLKEEAAWTPPTLADFERAAELPQLHDGGSSAATGADTVAKLEPQQQQRVTIVDIGVDVVSNWPRTPPPAGYGDCATATGHSCASTLLGEWAPLGNISLGLPSLPDFWTARLWNALVGSATFETKLSFFMPAPNSSVAIPAPPCDAASECVRVLGFRDRTNTSTILLLVNLDSNRSYVDAGESGRALHYLHRREWQLTVPSLSSNVVSLNGKLLTAAQRKAGGALPWTEPVSLAPNAAKAALSLPPLSLTFMQLGLIPGDGASAATSLKTDDDDGDGPADARVMTVARSNVDPAHDDSGALLNAHETQIVQWEPGGLWHMYAMKYALCHAGPNGKNGQACAKNRTLCDFRQDHNVSVFTSKDLSHGSWHWVADLLPSAAPPAAYFRGKVLQNRLTELYVLWIFGGENLVIATSQSPTGPFQLHSVEHSGGALLHKTGDLSFYIDSDATAYIIYNANMQGIAIEQLAPDYLSSLGRSNAARFSSAVFGAHATEAPVLFKKDETYYALFDHTCCVCSYGSGVGVWTSKSAIGNYSYRGQVARDPESDVPVTHAQQCWVLQLPDGSIPSHIWIGDRWGSASDGLHGHDMTYWQPIEFEADGGIRQFTWMDSFNISLALGSETAAVTMKSDDEDGDDSDASWCPSLHTIQGNDPSGPILVNGTWHVFVTCTDSGGDWQHYRSDDLMRWHVVAPTGFDPVTGSVGSAGGNHPLVAFWGNTSKPFPCCDIQASTVAQPMDPNLTTWRPLGRAIARPTSLSLHQGFRDPLRPLKLGGKWRIGIGSGSGADNTKPLQGEIHWFSAKDDTLLEWDDDGIFFAVPTTNGYVDPVTMAFNASWNRTLNQIECPDVFELDEKVVVLASLQFDGPWQGTSTSFFVGSIDSTGRHFTAESEGLIDYGQFYAGRTGTSVAAAPGDRRVLFGFSGYPSPTQPKVCQTLPNAYHGMYHVFPRELSLKDGRLNLAPVEELKTLHTVHQAKGIAITGPSSSSLATGSQLDVIMSCEWGDTPPTTGDLTLSIFEDTEVNESLLIGYDFSGQQLFVDHRFIGNATIKQTAPLARARLNGSNILRIITDNSMVETIVCSAVAVTSFVSPSGPTPPVGRQLRVVAVPKGAACKLDVFSISLKADDGASLPSLPAGWADAIAAGSMLVHRPNTSAPLDARLMPNIGNGRLGTLAGSSNVYLAGVYNLNPAAKFEPYRARLPGLAAMNIVLGTHSSQPKVCTTQPPVQRVPCGQAPYLPSNGCTSELGCCYAPFAAPDAARTNSRGLPWCYKRPNSTACAQCQVEVTPPPRPQSAWPDAQALDLRSATFLQAKEVDAGADCKVQVLMRTYAHRVRLALLSTDISVVASAGCPADATIHIAAGSGASPTAAGKQDFSWHAVAPTANTGTVFAGTTLKAELEGRLINAAFATMAPLSGSIHLVAKPGRRVVHAFPTAFVSDVDSSSDTATLAANASAELAAAVAIGGDALFAEHVNAVASERGRISIEIKGNPELARIVNVTLYSLRASLSKDVEWSTAPGGLTTGGRWTTDGHDTHGGSGYPEGQSSYYGHVFWDGDVWMLPALLPQHPRIARAMIGYRLRTMSVAVANAKAQGHNGTKWAWESAYSGVSATGGNCEEIHLQAGIAIAIRTHFRQTHDVDWLRQTAWPMLMNIVRFFESRVTTAHCPSGKLCLDGVQSPNEYASGIDNDIYTNAAYASVLAWLSVAARILGEPDADRYSELGAKTYIPFNSSLDRHEEYSGAPASLRIKQATMTMVPFPVGLDMPAQVQRNDLLYEDSLALGVKVILTPARHPVYFISDSPHKIYRGASK
jgi:sucrose-6-phosphate hydrolase SacC (GH32 family)